MASRRTERSFAFVVSIAVHAAIVAALTFSVSLGGSQPTQQIVVPIDTVMIDESAVREEIARLNAEEQARIRAEEEAAQLAREEADRARREREQEELELARVQQEREDAVAEAERERVRVEAERIRVLEQQRVEDERQAEQERIAQEAEDARREAELQAAEEARLAAERAAAEERRLEAERQARIAAIEAETAIAIRAEREAQAAADAGLRDQWARAIADRVRLYWTKPPNAGVGLECALQVTQLPDGEVINVTTDRCNTNDQNIIRSVENAVLNASPLPRPANSAIFERIIIITFRPDD